MTTGTDSFDPHLHPEGRFGGAFAALRSRVSGAAAPERNEPAAGATASPAEATAAPRDPIQEWRQVARRTFIAVGIFSVFVNLLMLTLPIYLFQISDRVLTSRSLDTLLMLSMLALGFIAVLSLLDILRRQVLGRLATQLETILGGPVLASVVTTAPASDGGNVAAAAQSASGARLHLQPDHAAAVRCAAGAALFRRRVPHPSRSRLHRAGRGLLLIAIALLNQRATCRRLAEASVHALEGRRAGRCRWRATRRSSTPWACSTRASIIGAASRPRALTVQSERARPQLLDQRRFEVRPPAGADRHPRAGAPIWRSRAAHRRHDDRRLDHRRPRAAAARRHDRGLAQPDADARRLCARPRRRRDACKSEKPRLLPAASPRAG